MYLELEKNNQIEDCQLENANENVININQNTVIFNINTYNQTINETYNNITHNNTNINIANSIKIDIMNNMDIIMNEIAKNPLHCCYRTK